MSIKTTTNAGGAMGEPISIYVNGDPKGQPRPRAFARMIKGRMTAGVYDAGTAEGWKSAVAVAARDKLPKVPFTGPIRVEMFFWFRRPKGHYRTGANADSVKASAPKEHTGKPDADNAAKAVLDALTTLGMWRDDSQIINLSIRKGWRGSIGPGCVIHIYPLEI